MLNADRSFIAVRPDPAGGLSLHAEGWSRDSVRLSIECQQNAGIVTLGWRNPKKSLDPVIAFGLFFSFFAGFAWWGLSDPHLGVVGFCVVVAIVVGFLGVIGAVYGVLRASMELMYRFRSPVILIADRTTGVIRGPTLPAPLPIDTVLGVQCLSVKLMEWSGEEPPPRMGLVTVVTRGAGGSVIRHPVMAAPWGILALRRPVKQFCVHAGLAVQFGETTPPRISAKTWRSFIQLTEPSSLAPSEGPSA